MSVPTKSVIAIVPFEEWTLRKSAEGRSAFLKYSSWKSETGEMLYGVDLGWVHLCDDVKGGVPGFDYSKDYGGWERVEEILFENGLKEEGKDYIIEDDYDEF